MTAKESWQKIWNFLWKDNSIWSWIVSLILAFIIVKFIFFPVVSLIFHNSLPLVVIESGSMHHPGNYFANVLEYQGSFNLWWASSGIWYETRNITKEQAQDWSFRTGLEKGDIIIVSNWGKPRIGDVIIFNAGQAYPIIHRIINITEINGQTVYSTKGDNNPDQLPVEKQIPESAVIGKAVFRIPLLGWIKLLFVDIINFFR